MALTTKSKTMNNQDHVKRMEQAIITFDFFGVPYNKLAAVEILNGLKKEGPKCGYSANPEFRGKVKGFEDSRKNK